MLCPNDQTRDGDVMPDYKCIIPTCKYNKKIIFSEARFFRKHLEENHFDRISVIALGTSFDFKEVVRILEEKSKIKTVLA